jgi:hypothetical protein
VGSDGPRRDAVADHFPSSPTGWCALPARVVPRGQHALCAATRTSDSAGLAVVSASTPHRLLRPVRQLLPLMPVESATGFGGLVSVFQVLRDRHTKVESSTVSTRPGTASGKLLVDIWPPLRGRWGLSAPRQGIVGRCHQPTWVVWSGHDDLVRERYERLGIRGDGRRYGANGWPPCPPSGRGSRRRVRRGGSQAHRTRACRWCGWGCSWCPRPARLGAHLDPHTSAWPGACFVTVGMFVLGVRKPGAARPPRSARSTPVGEDGTHVVVVSSSPQAPCWPTDTISAVCPASWTWSTGRVVS